MNARVEEKVAMLQATHPALQLNSFRDLPEFHPEGCVTIQLIIPPPGPPLDPISCPDANNFPLERLLAETRIDRHTSNAPRPSRRRFHIIVL